MLEKKLITSGVFFYYLALFTSMLSSLLITPIVVRYLGQSVYGLWSVFGSVVGYFGLLNFGLNAAVVRYTAEYRAKENPESLNRLVSSALAVFAFVGVFIVLITAGLTPYVPRLFHLREDLVFPGQIASFRRVPAVKKYLWGGKFWSDGTYLSTVGQHSSVSEGEIQRYIARQDRQQEYSQLHTQQLRLF